MVQLGMHISAFLGRQCYRYHQPNPTMMQYYIAVALAQSDLCLIVLYYLLLYCVITPVAAASVEKLLVLVML